MKNAFLFPGQGAQYIGMCHDLYDEYKVVKDLFKLCADVTGKDIPKLLFESDESELQKTDNAQIAMTLVSISVAKVLEERGIVPDLVAGFSLGEYASLVVSGIVSIEDIFDLVVIRGKIMDEAKHEIEAKFKDEGNVGMTAVLGIPPDDIHTYLETWNIPNVYLSMYNSPIQGVLGGTEKARNIASEKLIENGARKIIPLKVAGPFHTPLMEDAKQKFHAAIENTVFHNPNIMVFSNVNGKQVKSGDDMKLLCVEQLVNPVRWIEEEGSIWENMPTHIFEVGAGNVLTGLWKAWKKSQEENNHIPSCVAVGIHETIKNLEV